MKQPFTPIAHIDTWALSASLRGKLGLFEPAGAEGKGSGSSFLTRAMVKTEWKALDNLISTSIFFNITNSWIHRLDRQSDTGWDLLEDGGQIAVLPIVTNPSCWFFVGPSALHLPIGALTVLDATRPICVVNWGEQPHFHLWVEFRQKETQDE